MSKITNRRPKLIVFDLDYTLWPFWMQRQPTPPFHKNAYGRIVDSKGAPIRHYEDVPDILKSLTQQGYILAIASRTPKASSAEQLIELFGWNKYFTYKEIYPGSKTLHFSKFREQSGISYKDMLFFDDEPRNLFDLRNEGVVSVLVKRGLTKKIVENGLKFYANNL